MRWHWGRLTRGTKGECPGEWRKSLKEIGGPKNHSHLADSFSSSGFPFGFCAKIGLGFWCKIGFGTGGGKRGKKTKADALALGPP